MSTLKTTNLQNADASSANIVLGQGSGGGATISGVTTSSTLRATTGKTLEGSETEFSLVTASNQVAVELNEDYYKELVKIKNCAKFGKSIGLEVHAGHGMDYKTIKILNKIKEIKEFNIGHFIIGESIFVGLSQVVKILKEF